MAESDFLSNRGNVYLYISHDYSVLSMFICAILHLTRGLSFRLPTVFTKKYLLDGPKRWLQNAQVAVLNSTMRRFLPHYATHKLPQSIAPSGNKQSETSCAVQLPQRHVLLLKFSAHTTALKWPSQYRMVGNIA